MPFLFAMVLASMSTVLQWHVLGPRTVSWQTPARSNSRLGTKPRWQIHSLRAVFAADGRLGTPWACIAGNHETHLEGTYYLRYTDDSASASDEPVGNNADGAVKMMHSRQIARAGERAVGLQVVDPWQYAHAHE
jgi:hypothetical protein